MWIPELLVAVGGAIGSVLRFKASQWIAYLGLGWQFPIATFVVNVLGCAAIGVLARISEQTGAITPNARAFLFAGFLGGFTTFSAFGLEAVELLRRGELGIAATYVLSSVAVGLGVLWLSMPS